MKQVYIICGPTASGKSLFGMNLADKLGGEIINADSMQIYTDLEIMTASPYIQDKAKINHHLYNFLKPDSTYSVARYLEDVEKVINKVDIPIIVGGSGMYINGLVNGISSIPEISEKIKEEAEEYIKKDGIEYLHSLLAKLDPDSANKLKPKDTQRVKRAYEVVRQTGKSIVEFQKELSKPALCDYQINAIYLKPERKFLYEICDLRLEAMISKGGLEEIERFHAKFPRIQTSASKVLAVPEIIQYIEGKISLKKAIELAQIKTRNYAKRQFTWFNHQLNFDYQIIEYSSMDEFYSNLKN